MKKLFNYILVLILLLGIFGYVRNQTLAQEADAVQCGGIQGLACPSGLRCIYSDGSTMAPHPDASGICRSDQWNCKSKANGTACKMCQPCPTGHVCAAVCNEVSGTCQSQTCTVAPTATPTPIPPWNIAPVTAGTENLCTSLVLSDNNIGPGETITATAKSTSSDIVAFGWWFYNLDNLTAANAAKPITFVSTGDNVAGVVQHKQIAVSQASLQIDFFDINRRDFNWNYYMPKPKRVRVDAYFKKAGSTAWSKFDANCSKTFNAATVDPTPTPVSTCNCAAAGTCAASCFFDKFASGVTYANPVKCNLGDALFKTAPTAANKNQWCRSYVRTRGDANGDGKVGILDYFYYVSGAVFGAKLPPTVNIDFNGDGVVSSADKAVLLKTLKP